VNPRIFPAFLLLASVTTVSCGGPEAISGEAGRVPPSPSASAPEPREGGGRKERARPAGSARIVFLGDSLTAGLGLPVDQSFPALVQDRLDREGYDYEVINAGVSGDTSAGGLRRLDWALDGNVKVLVVALGGNDGLRGLPPGELKKNLAAIVDRGRQRGLTVILAGMEAPPNNGPEYTGAFRQAYADLAREAGVPFIPFLLQGVAGDARHNQPDGIHPNASGAELVAETVWRALEPALTREGPRAR
jgi:acyl-CoA thioesterase-1